MPEDREQVDQHDPEEVLRAVAEHELGLVGEVVLIQGAAVAATAKHHGRKVQR